MSGESFVQRGYAGGGIVQVGLCRRGRCPGGVMSWIYSTYRALGCHFHGVKYLKLS